MFPTATIHVQTYIYSHNQPPPTMQHQSQLPNVFTNGFPLNQPQNQLPMSHLHHQSPVQVPLAYIPTPTVNHPTTTSQTITSHNKGQTLYMTYSDADSVPNGDMDDESGNTHLWQAVVKERKRNPQSNLIENSVPSTTHNRYEPL